MLSVVIEAFRKSVMFLCTLSQIVVWYTATGLYITLHSSSARLEGIHPVWIHLLGNQSEQQIRFIFPACG